MTHPRTTNLTLHVFEQEGGWHWALTIERPQGTGKKVIAFSEEIFSSQAQARTDGERAEAQWEHDGGLRRSELA
jgi:hypothetical protein